MQVIIGVSKQSKLLACSSRCLCYIGKARNILQAVLNSNVSCTVRARSKRVLLLLSESTDTLLFLMDLLLGPVEEYSEDDKNDPTHHIPVKYIPKLCVREVNPCWWWQPCWTFVILLFCLLMSHKLHYRPVYICLYVKKKTYIDYIVLIWEWRADRGH